MNPYAMLGSSTDTTDATSLSARATAWHDAMVAHERKLRTGNLAEVCDDECPHAEARLLWAEAVAAVGPRAQQLTFLRTQAIGRAAASRSHAAGKRNGQHVVAN